MTTPGTRLRLPYSATLPAKAMSLRDWFAAAALPVWVHAHINQSVDDLSKPDIARECYSYADAMLAEREKGKP